MKKLNTEELNRPTLDEYRKLKKKHTMLLLDNVRSLHNVGSAFRTADAMLAEKIWLCGITGTPPNRELHKTALGAEESVEWEYSESPAAVILKLKEAGYTIVCLEQTDGSVMLQDFEPGGDEKYCFVFGNEVFGIDEKLIEMADICLEIPQFGTKHSLNVSVSVGMVLWDYFVKTSR